MSELREVTVSEIKEEVARLMALEDTRFSPSRILHELNAYLQHTPGFDLLVIEYPPFKLQVGMTINPGKKTAPREEFFEWYIRPMVNAMLSSRRH